MFIFLNFSSKVISSSCFSAPILPLYLDFFSTFKFTFSLERKCVLVGFLSVICTSLPFLARLCLSLLFAQSSLL